MRLVVAPDAFAGTLSAGQAAEAIAAGWRERAPGDDCALVPLSDGGPGFVDVMYAALGGRLLPVTVADPLGRPVEAAVLLAADTAYVESAQACGLHRLTAAERDPRRTTTYGVGQLIAAALDAGAGRIVVGLGGSGTNDGGRGMLGALGVDGERPDLGALNPRLRDVDLVAATDVDNPLLGLHGASAVFGPQKGASPADIAVLDAELADWSQRVAPELATAPGAGAAGGLGFALLAAGARRVPGIATVLDVVGLPARVAAAELVITGEGSFDWQSLRGKVVSGVAAAAAEAALPCLVLAGQVSVGRREMTAAGIEAAYAVADSAGSVDAALARPAEELRRLAARVAGTWSRRGRPPGSG